LKKETGERPQTAKHGQEQHDPIADLSSRLATGGTPLHLSSFRQNSDAIGEVGFSLGEIDYRSIRKVRSKKGNFLPRQRGNSIFRPGMNHRQRFRFLVAHGLVAAFLFALGLSVAPQLHEHFHGSGESSHECAVTLISAGKCEQGNAPIRLIVPQLAIAFSKVLIAHSAQVPSLFLGAAIFEHAPPSFA
jgi:hypothetical protein